MIFWFKSKVQEVENELKKSGSSVSFDTKGCKRGIGYCLQVFLFLVFVYGMNFHWRYHLLSLFRVLGKQLLLPKDEGFQHFQSRSDAHVDTKCLPALCECTSNIKEYVHFLKSSFWFTLFRNMYKYYFCITETILKLCISV